MSACVVVAIARGQNPVERVPRFRDYPVKDEFKGEPTLPVLETPEERKFQDVIRDGVSKGWGVYDGATGREFRRPGPNFAGHYILVNFGCDDPYSFCLGTAIVDARTGRVYRPPTPQSGVSWRPYFGVLARWLAPHPPSSFHNFQLKSPLAYRLDSRLLITDTCEGVRTEGGSVLTFPAVGCGAHYYLMDENGLKLIARNVE
jgi:hypothetical protein